MNVPNYQTLIRALFGCCITTLVILCDVAQASEAIPASVNVITAAEITKIVIVPIFLVIITGIIINSVTRYHLIRNLYCEIAENVGWYCKVGELFGHWKKTNIARRPSKEPAQIERITWNIPLFINTYNSAQSEIRSTLWGREIADVHKLYAKFKTLDSMIGALSREIEKAKDSRLRHSDIKLKFSDIDQSDRVKLEQLIASDEARQGIIIKGYADQIAKDLSDLAAFSNPRACARGHFYGRWFYLFHLGAIVVVVLLLAGIIRSL